MYEELQYSYPFLNIALEVQYYNQMNQLIK